MVDLRTMAASLEESPVKRTTASRVLEATEMNVGSMDIDQMVGAFRNVRFWTSPVFFADVLCRLPKTAAG